jgi:hypothetical protein
MIGRFQYLIRHLLKFQWTIHFRGREQRVRTYQTPLDSNFSEHPCRFQLSNSLVATAPRSKSWTFQATSGHPDFISMLGPWDRFSIVDFAYGSFLL